MRVIEAGHLYHLDSLDQNGEVEVLRFVKRKGPRYPGNHSAYGGTTSQEVLRALIERAQYVNNQIPCWQTGLSVWFMRAVVWLYEHRAAQVHNRSLCICLLPSIEKLDVCLRCGHVECSEH